MRTYLPIFYTLLLLIPFSIFGQTVNTTPVNLVGSSDPMPGPGPFLGHPFTPSPLTGTYHGGVYYGATKEKWGYEISDLTIAEEYVLTVYYMYDVVIGTPAYDRIGNLSLQSGAALDFVTIPYVAEPDWRNWYSMTVTFTAISTTDRIDIEADGITDNSLWLWTDMDIDGGPACEGETPTSHFEFLVGELSSEDGATGACVTTPIQFNDLSVVDDPNVIESWSWDFGDGETSTEENPLHTFDASGTYTVTLTVTTDGGCTETFTLEIVMTDGLALDLIFNEPTCFGFNDGSVTVNVLDGSGELVFDITNSEGTTLNEDNSNTANELVTGWYYINVSDDSECSGIDSVFLDQPGKINIELTTFDVLCYEGNSGWARVDDVINYTGDYDAISYFWNPNPPSVEGLGADSIWSLSAGNYTVTVNDENGCSGVFDFEITQPDELVVTLGSRPALCRMFGYQNGNGVVYGDATGGKADYVYNWTNVETGDFINNTTWGGINPGNYEFTATDNNGCVTKQTIYLDSINPEAIFSVHSDQLNSDCQGTASVEVEFINESINFSDSLDPLADSIFFWNLNSPNGPLELTHDFFYSPDTIYGAEGQSYEVEVCLEVINKNGCKDSYCKILTIYEPIKFTHVNIFTPNGDGKNDLFTFDYTSASISEFKCVIVNRWGITVHEMISITDGWDGTDLNGDLVKDGVYFYTYTAVTDNSTSLAGQGNVTVVNGK